MVVGRSVLGPIMEQNTLEVLILVCEDLSLKIIRPVPARDELLTAVSVVGITVTGIGDVA